MAKKETASTKSTAKKPATKTATKAVAKPAKKMKVGLNIFTGIIIPSKIKTSIIKNSIVTTFYFL